MAGSKHDTKMFIPHVHNTRTENGFENRFEIVILPMENLKHFMFCHSSHNRNTLLLHRFKKIRHDLLRKETYIVSAKLQPLFLKLGPGLGFNDTLRDLKILELPSALWMRFIL